MKLDRVTITGADDSIEPADLLCLSRMYPYVEWGILMSKNSQGKPRFPSETWLWKFRMMQKQFPVNASMHLCGSWLRDLLMGNASDEVSTFIDCFRRVQLNFHAEPLTYDDFRFRQALNWLVQDREPRPYGHPLHRGLEFIFQVDGGDGEKLLRSMWHPSVPFSCVPLFDLSHGAGALPGQWPKPIIPNAYHGYAGGLGPDNLAEQLPLIDAAAGDVRVWIDMESKVRSKVGEVFDLEKVRRCLEIAKPIVTGA